ncbi:aminoglycoside phosphotransferase family protein [Ruminiclostridium josui]|uniref:aminoglycoside phosphotransferase family protein n=1 Tax=Ruminiclostridium josui TaxID=1499 RepID=UPI000466A3A0|nr:aminoglycoside phosphotransferase family protein [Ruminiclostridium josui]
MDEKKNMYMGLIRSRCPQINITKVEYLINEGRYNDVIIINDTYIFKFARYDWSVAYLDNEAKVTNFIRNRIEPLVPAHEPLGREMVKYNIIKGKPILRNLLLQLNGKHQETLAQQIGTFLKSLHTIPVEEAENMGIGEFQNPIDQNGWEQFVDEIYRKVFPYCSDYTKEYIKQVFKPVENDDDFLSYEPSLIHGDLSAYHLLIDSRLKKLTGVIGFALSGLGDPAYDVGILLDNLGEAFLKRVARYYPSLESLLDRARFYATLNDILWVRDIADMITTRDFTNFRFNIRERDIMPIGFRW